VEDTNESLEVASLGRPEERLHGLSLAHRIDVACRCAVLDPAAGPAGQLAGRVGRAVQDSSDLVEGHGEDVVEHEGHAFGRPERLEHDQQGGAHGLGEERPVLDVTTAGHISRQRGPCVVLRAGLAPAQPVQANPCRHRGQPAAQVVDGTRIRPAEPEPGLLHRVLGLGPGAQHPVGDRLQARPVLLELRGQPVGRIHRPTLTHRPAAM
jgi:hypothetical protein